MPVKMLSAALRILYIKRYKEKYRGPKLRQNLGTGEVPGTKTDAKLRNMQVLGGESEAKLRNTHRSKTSFWTTHTKVTE